MRQQRRDGAADPAVEQSRRAPLHVADGQRGAILALQRSVGNRAVSRLINHREGRNANPPERSVARVPETSPPAATTSTAADVGEAGEARQTPLWKQWWDQRQLDAAAGAKAKEVEPYARAKAKELISKAEDVEPRVTGHVRAVAFSRRGKPKGLQYRIKSEESLARKLTDKAAENPLSMLAPAKAVQQEAEQISDTLRYTIILGPDATYGHLFSEISETMTKFRYTPELRKNYWEKSTTYKGINLTFKTPGTTPIGFEVQLHTEDSFATKQLNHHEYEEERTAGTSPERKKVLNETMQERWKSVPVPEGFWSVEPTRARR